mmetsp:Transcript_74910/g.200932  ORF Transcript_74910/g.200932 Transcript_74910/m.200932 type:complete len:213 (-) Transcript_74910:776-1414(-)
MDRMVRLLLFQERLQLGCCDHGRVSRHRLHQHQFRLQVPEGDSCRENLRRGEGVREFGVVSDGAEGDSASAYSCDVRSHHFVPGHFHIRRGCGASLRKRQYHSIRQLQLGLLHHVSSWDGRRLGSVYHASRGWQQRAHLGDVEHQLRGILQQHGDHRHWRSPPRLQQGNGAFFHGLLLHDLHLPSGRHPRYPPRRVHDLHAGGAQKNTGRGV